MKERPNEARGIVVQFCERKGGKLRTRNGIFCPNEEIHVEGSGHFKEKRTLTVNSSKDHEGKEDIFKFSKWKGD